jgi:hypothetical protein
MNPMKILIDYDESPCSTAMLVDLKQAGLPDRAEAMVLSFAEVWLADPEELVAWGSEEYDAQADIVDSPSAAMFRDMIGVSVEGRALGFEALRTDGSVRDRLRQSLGRDHGGG